MRKTVIAILLVIAMLFVSCSPNATENKTPADGGESSGGAESKEPTAEEFFASFYAAVASEEFTYYLYQEKSYDSEGNVDKDKVSAIWTSNFFEDDTCLNRYTVTEITEASGTVKGRYEADNVIVKFKYYVESRETSTSDWPKTHTGEEKTGGVALSFKYEETESGWAYSNIKLSYVPTRDGSLPALDNAEATSYKSISVTCGSDGKATSASVDGVQLSDTEWAKVDAVINAVG